MNRRVPGRLERLLDRVPFGDEHLELVSGLVREDLPEDEDLLALMGVAPDSRGQPRPQSPRIRPVLVALAARATGASRVDPELQYAAEMLHVALAAHDLALGRRRGRRRRVAKRLVRRSVGWMGESPVTLRALELARHASSPHVLGELVDTLREMADGEALARELRDAVPNRQDWREHADGHSGALFAFCCRAGGHLGQGSQAVLSALGRYGRHLGRIWHVAEDLSLLERDRGAHLLSRSQTGRPVYPLVALAAEDPRVAHAWSRLLEAPRSDDADALARDVLAAGGASTSRERMARECWSAVRALRGLPSSPYRNGLERLATGLARTARRP